MTEKCASDKIARGELSPKKRAKLAQHIYNAIMNSEVRHLKITQDAYDAHAKQHGINLPGIYKVEFILYKDR